MFFLGEIYTDLPLPVDTPTEAHCGSCEACITVCPTQAIVAPYQLDARRCISYLTIEHKTAIPVELRPLMGNRILGCDDCQLVCPWNKFAQKAVIPDFDVRNAFDQSKLIDLFAWTEEEFNTKCEGSAIRRIGHERWLRNIAIALGNALRHSDTTVNEASEIVLALQSRLQHSSALVQEHVTWALAQQGATE
jgi:epoxyqueuosine reductase